MIRMNVDGWLDMFKSKFIHPLAVLILLNIIYNNNENDGNNNI